jgi:hypothetical protein
MPPKKYALPLKKNGRFDYNKEKTIFFEGVLINIVISMQRNIWVPGGHGKLTVNGVVSEGLVETELIPLSTGFLFEYKKIGPHSIITEEPGFRVLCIKTYNDGKECSSASVRFPTDAFKPGSTVAPTAFSSYMAESNERLCYNKSANELLAAYGQYKESKTVAGKERVFEGRGASVSVTAPLTTIYEGNFVDDRFEDPAACLFAHNKREGWIHYPKISYHQGLCCPNLPFFFEVAGLKKGVGIFQKVDSGSITYRVTTSPSISMIRESSKEHLHSDDETSNLMIALETIFSRNPSGAFLNAFIDQLSIIQLLHLYHVYCSSNPQLGFAFLHIADERNESTLGYKRCISGLSDNYLKTCIQKLKVLFDQPCVSNLSPVMSALDMIFNHKATDKDYVTLYTFFPKLKQEVLLLFQKGMAMLELQSNVQRLSRPAILPWVFSFAHVHLKAYPPINELTLMESEFEKCYKEKCDDYDQSLAEYERLSRDKALELEGITQRKSMQQCARISVLDQAASEKSDLLQNHLKETKALVEHYSLNYSELHSRLQLKQEESNAYNRLIKPVNRFILLFNKSLHGLFNPRDNFLLATYAQKNDLFLRHRLDFIQEACHARIRIREEVVRQSMVKDHLFEGFALARNAMKDDSYRRVMTNIIVEEALTRQDAIVHMEDLARQDMMKLLAQFLIKEQLLFVLKRFEHPDTYIVGGAVALYLTGESLKAGDDVDVMIVQPPWSSSNVEAMKQLDGFSKSPYMENLYVTTWFIPGVGGCRIEVKVKILSPEADYLERDFSRGAVYFTREGEVLDPTEIGVRDIHAKLLRTVAAQPADFLVLSPVNVLRAIKFLMKGYQFDALLHAAILSWQLPDNTTFVERDHALVTVRKQLEAYRDDEDDKQKKDYVSHLLSYNLFFKIFDISEQMPEAAIKALNQKPVLIQRRNNRYGFHQEASPPPPPPYETTCLPPPSYEATFGCIH